MLPRMKPRTSNKHKCPTGANHAARRGGNLRHWRGAVYIHLWVQTPFRHWSKLQSAKLRRAHTKPPQQNQQRLKESDFILNVHPDGRSVAPKHMRENSPEQEVLVSENDLRCSTDITKTTTGARRPHWAFHHKKRCVQELLYLFSDWKNVIKYFQTS